MCRHKVLWGKKEKNTRELSLVEKKSALDLTAPTTLNPHAPASGGILIQKKFHQPRNLMNEGGCYKSEEKSALSHSDANVLMPVSPRTRSLLWYNIRERRLNLYRRSK